MVTFFSPCVFPLVPAYLAQLTGTDVKGGAVNANRGLIISRSVGFITGFTIIFLLLGLSASAIGTWFALYGTLIERIGGIIIILFGLQMSGLISLQSLITERRIFKRGPKKSLEFFWFSRLWARIRSRLDALYRINSRFDIVYGKPRRNDV
ncbi:cytochrome c biogenesis CcdA family protein [Geomicrobium sp. JCM 19037]|uniref:cytochrome c biogenesis CcdA family protein n=1 Tax=Geomicrobium sp. JCM 19037 TaxID=1460634 RepID=UPI002101476B|nr:cytochrome c biogenesis protein CcdA [Geomicrobium sp. JCM 19037]